MLTEMSQVTSLLSHALKGHIYPTYRSQCHDCRWPGYARSQDISSRDTDLFSPNYPGHNTRMIKIPVCNFNISSQVVVILGILAHVRFITFPVVANGIVHLEDDQHLTDVSNLPDLYYHWQYLDGLVQDCSISTANTLEILQSCTKPLICAAGPITHYIGGYSNTHQSEIHAELL